MAINGAFQPQGNTVTVGTAAVQAPAAGSNPSTCYRVRNLQSTVLYLTWGNASTVTAVGGAGANTVGMLPNSVETFMLSGGPNIWFITTIAGGFEITPGEGL